MNVSTQSLQAALNPLVGGRVRPAEAADMVAGVQPQVVVEPISEEEIAAVLAFANREGFKVLTRGGGTQLNMGFPPTGGDILLSTTHLNRVIEHAPHDMTATVQAGMRLAEFQAVLGKARQWLALDPELEADATIGGLVATNATGARRLRYGGVRDQIIGIRIVTADGTIAKGGGKVVKNVAGYDLPKLFTGSLGTLGVIVAATFRLYPLPAASRTVVLAASALAPLCDLALRILAATLVPTMVDITGSTAHDSECTLAVRFETIPAAVEDQAATLIDMAHKAGQATVGTMEGEVETQFWQQAAVNAAPPGRTGPSILLKVSLLPTEVVHWLESLRQMAREMNLQVRWRAHAGHGLIFARLSGSETALITAAERLRQVAMDHRGTLVVIDAPPALAQQVDVWGPIPALDLMRRMKASFDPNAILNPGRFVGRI
jgi:glycolate oxidase FAD binding subunit